MRGTNGHCDCPGWFQQHLSMGANEQVPPEINTVPRHWAQKHTGINAQAKLLYWDGTREKIWQELVLGLFNNFGSGSRSASYSMELIPSSCSG